MNPELLQRWWTPLLSLAGGFLAGFLLEKIVVRKLRKISAKTPWEWDNIFAETLSGFPFIWCLLAGVYGMALTATVSADHLKKIEKLLLVVSIVSVTVFVARLSVRLAEFYSRKDHGVFPSATILTHLARVYNRLSPEEKSRSVIFAQNYGEAGVISFLGKKYTLPRVLSSHNNYWIWGPGDPSVDLVIVVGGDPEDNEAVFESVEHADTVRCKYCMPYENNLPVYIGRKMKVPIDQLWPSLKHYD